MTPITDDQIFKLALENGFKLKKQPNGKFELNPYVYEFARALLAVSEQLQLYAPLPNCMCTSTEAERFCLLGRKCSKATAY